MKFVCDSAAGRGTTVLLALNPVTRTEVKLSPPFPWESHEQLDAFARRFEAYCAAAWEFARLDPNEINVSTWPNHLPSGASGGEVAGDSTASDTPTTG